MLNVPADCWKSQFVLDLIEKEYNKHFDYRIIIYSMLQWHIMPRIGSDMMGSCRYHYQTQEHYS